MSESLTNKVLELVSYLVVHSSITICIIIYWYLQTINLTVLQQSTTQRDVHSNARSLKKNLTKIKDCLDALKCSFDIIAISETWEDQTNPISVYEMSNYNVFSTARTNKKEEV